MNHIRAIHEDTEKCPERHGFSGMVLAVLFVIYLSVRVVVVRKGRCFLNVQAIN